MQKIHKSPTTIPFRTPLQVLLVGSALSLTGGQAQAEVQPGDGVSNLLIRDGNNAGITNRDEEGRDKPKRQVGTGQEQVQMTQLPSGEIMMFGIGSYEMNGEPVYDRLQMLCTSIGWDALNGPVVQAMKYVTNNDGDRYRNGMHPRVVATSKFAGGVALVTFNYADNNDNLAKAYMNVFGPGCTPLSEQTIVMAKNNDNCSENDGTGVVVRETANSLSWVDAHGCNGNGRDDMWMGGADLTLLPDGKVEIEKTWDFTLEKNEERSRPNVLAAAWNPVNPDEVTHVASCWTAGNTQPPNKGVRCGYVDVREGIPTEERLIWRQYVAERDDDIYRTMIRTSPLLDAQGGLTNMVAATYQESQGRRRSRNDKGNHALMSTMLKFTPEGMDMMKVPNKGIFTTGDATHGTQCSTMWGVDGAERPAVALLSTSFNGNPNSNSVMKIVEWDPVAREYKDIRRVGLNTSIDNAWLSNIYGENPTNQGRNFVQCKGGILNPGYGIDGGYMPDVKSFIAIPSTSRRMDPATGYAEDKLATLLTLVPAVVAPDAQNPDDPTGGDDIDDPPTVGEDPGASFSDAGGCSTSGSGASGSMLLLIGLGLFIARRRNS